MKNVNERKNTPYQLVKNSIAGQFVRENQLLSTGGAVGSAIVIAGGAEASESFRKIAEKAVVPLVGASVSGYGLALTHDAFVNELGRSKPRAAGKALLGAVMALGGAEIVGRSFDIPVLEQALSGPYQFLVRQSRATGTVLGAGAIVAGSASVYDGVKKDLGNNRLKASAKIVGGAAVGLAGVETIGQIHEIRALQPSTLMFERSGSIVGVAITTGGVAVGTFAVGRLKKAAAGENVPVNGALGVGSAVTSAAAILGGVELIGRDLNIPIAKEALSGTVKAIAKHGVGSTAAGTLLVGGAAVLGYEAIKNTNKNGNTMVGAVEAVGAATAAAGGLQLIGHGLGIPALRGVLTEHAPIVWGAQLAALGAAMAKVSVDDFRKKGLTAPNALGMTIGAATVSAGVAAAGVIEPAIEFLYKKPVAGALVVGGAMVAGGGYWYYNKKQTEKNTLAKSN